MPTTMYYFTPQLQMRLEFFEHMIALLMMLQSQVTSRPNTENSTKRPILAITLSPCLGASHLFGKKHS